MSSRTVVRLSTGLKFSIGCFLFAAVCFVLVMICEVITPNPCFRGLAVYDFLLRAVHSKNHPDRCVSEVSLSGYETLNVGGGLRQSTEDMD